MSFLNDFEGRISSVFGAAPQGYTCLLYTSDAADE